MQNSTKHIRAKQNRAKQRQSKAKQNMPEPSREISQGRTRQIDLGPSRRDQKAKEESRAKLSIS